VFVDIDHVTSADGVQAISERQTIVYREPSGATAVVAAPAAPDVSAWEWRREVIPSPPMLFRYSALTFNSHRIHYDVPYATEVEGYPGLVVHGPLTATLLLDLAARYIDAGKIHSLTFRAVAPCFAGQTLYLVGRRDGNGYALAALAHNGRMVMTATAGVRGI
jgi:3-methylfumaryl-CoA hydratase